eukprot:XP_019081541.1 PREDICTED: uncharacterized protein LOC109124195 [Vitis vinifera]
MGDIAPEMLSRNLENVSYKSDVFSYGMLLLEMVGGRKNIDVTADNTSPVYFPGWIYNHLDQAQKPLLPSSFKTLSPPRQNIIPNPHSHKNPNFEPLKNRRIRQLDVGHLNHALSSLDLMTLQNVPPDLTPTPSSSSPASDSATSNSGNSSTGS